MMRGGPVSARIRPIAGAADPPEFRLLLRCCHVDTTNAREEIQSILQDISDWPSLLQAAHLHGVTPLVQRALLQTGATAIPSKAIAELRARSGANAANSLALTAELLQVLSLFDGHLRAIAYKGPAQAAVAYADVGMREFVDLDLLVARDDILRAKDLLRANGYHPEAELSPAEEALRLRTGCELNFISPRGTLVEVHWRVLPESYGIRFPFDDLWRRARPVAIGHREVATLSPEDLLLVLSVHGMKHEWSKLQWLCDIAQLVGDVSLDYPAALRDAKQMGCRRIVLFALYLTHTFLGAPLPPASEACVKGEKGFASLSSQVRRSMLARMTGENGPTKVRRHLLLSRLRDNWEDRIRFSAREMRRSWQG